MVHGDDIRDRVQHATDIVRLISEQITLRPRGKEFVGLCPFHDDSRPSLYISPAKQIFKCFACGAGGDVFGFVMKYHKMTFPEAIRYLGERAGIEIPERRIVIPGSDQQPNERQRISIANTRALEFYQALLADPRQGQLTRRYITERGFSPKAVADFQLGYAPDRWDGLAGTIREKRWDRSAFEAAGLIAARSGGDGYYDRFRHRLIFPISDALGRPVAFGGRVLPGGTLQDKADAKYLNSPETPLFNKSTTLYGLHLAKKSIIDGRMAVIVEGYTDVIACHQAGQRNVVGTLGTSLTAQHVAHLRRYAEKVVLVFDADEAGQNAADRAVELFLRGDLDVAMAVLPKDWPDPAELMAQEDGPELWRTAIERADDALTYQFSRVRAQMAAVTTLTGRQNIAESYLGRVAQLGLARLGPIRRALIIQRLATLLHTSESTVAEALERSTAFGRRPLPTSDGRPAGPRSGDEPAAAANNTQTDVATAETRPKLKAVELAERQLIGCLIKENGLFELPLPDGRPVMEAIKPAQMVGAGSRPLYERIYHRLKARREFTLAHLLGDLAADENASLAELATLAEAEAERAMETPDQSIESILTSAAQRVLTHDQEQDYEQTKTRLVSRAQSAKEDVEVNAKVLNCVREHLNANPSPVRIAKVHD